MTTSKIFKLPRWATLVRPEGENELKISKDSPDKKEIEEEEVYMRKRCFHILSKEMEEAMDDVLEDSLAPCLSTLEDFLNAAAPTPEQQPSRKRQKISPSPRTTAKTNFLEGLDTSLFDRQQETQASHDPLLLPVILLQGPSSGEDRRVQMDCLARNLQKRRCRSAVVQVHLSLQRRCQGMQELVRQCHCLCPVLSTGPLYRRIVKRKKKRALSFSDLLLLWAQNVSDYDEIVVFLNADESFYSPELQDFLHVLATRRAEQGIPINLVMLGPPEGRRHMELKSSLQGYAGFMIRSLTLPSCELLLDRFWRRLWMQMKFPILFPQTLLEAMERSYRYYQKSSQRTLHKLQQILAHKFVLKGSFLAVTHHPSVLNEIWQRMAWFLTYEEARQFLLGDPATEVTSTQMLKAMEAIHSEHENAQLSLHLMDTMLMHSNKKNQATLLFQSSFSGLLRKRTRRDLIEELVNLRKRIDWSKDSKNEAPSCQKLLIKYTRCVSLESAGQMADDFAKEQIAGKRNFINELIVLVGNCRDGDDLSEVEQLFDAALAGWVRHNATPELSFCEANNLTRKMTAEAGAMVKEWRVLADSLAAEPRRQIVAALLQVPEAWDWPDHGSPSKPSLEDRKHPPLAYIAGVMYRLIHDRVAVTQEDWFEEFWQSAIVDSGAECPREDSFTLFSLGLRYLKQCGLIVEKLRVGSRSDIIYERAKLVWCATFH